MRFLLFFALFLPTTLLADSSASFPPNPYDLRGGNAAPAVADANAKAIYWINLVDQHQYGATWLEASTLVQDVTTQEQWAMAMEGLRSELGTANARKVTAHEISYSLPHGTRGTFITFTFATSYAQLPDAVETITLMKEGPLGFWKVVFYDISRN